MSNRIGMVGDCHNCGWQMAAKQDYNGISCQAKGVINIGGWSQRDFLNDVLKETFEF